MKQFAPLLLILAQPLPAQEISQETLTAIREVSVSIEIEGRLAGSGTIFRKDKDPETYCVTAAHVTKCSNKPLVTVSQYRGKGKAVSVLGEILSQDEATDIAVLRLGKGVFKRGAHFYAEKDPPAADSVVVHCGSMVGMHHSMARGWITEVGRCYPCFGDCQCGDNCGCSELDQGDFTVYPGSSGGGVFLADGRCIGMVVRGVPTRLAFFVPVRQMGFLKPSLCGCCCK